MEGQEKQTFADTDQHKTVATEAAREVKPSALAYTYRAQTAIIVDRNVPRGTKEVSEILVACTALGVAIAKRFKDGVDFSDIVAVFGDVQGPVMTAIEGLKEVQGELDDLDIEESADLGILSLNGLKDIIRALRDEE